MKKDKQMEKYKWIAKFVEKLELKNEEEFKDFLVRKFEVEFIDAFTGENIVAIPEINIDITGISVSYDLEHDKGEYTENGQRLYDALETQVLLHNYTFSSGYGYIDNHITSKYVLFGVDWDKLENITKREGTVRTITHGIHNAGELICVCVNLENTLSKDDEEFKCIESQLKGYEWYRDIYLHLRRTIRICTNLNDSMKNYELKIKDIEEIINRIVEDCLKSNS